MPAQGCSCAHPPHFLAPNPLVIAQCRDRLAKERWRFRQVQTPQAKVPLLAAIIGELETVQGVRLKPSPSRTQDSRLTFALPSASRRLPPSG